MTTMSDEKCRTYDERRDVPNVTVSALLPEGIFAG